MSKHLVKKAVVLKKKVTIGAFCALLMLIMLLFSVLMVGGGDVKQAKQSMSVASSQVLVEEGVFDSEQISVFIEAAEDERIPWQLLAATLGNANSGSSSAAHGSSSTNPDFKLLDGKTSPLEWAMRQEGKHYSQPRRNEENFFDCSSLVQRAFKATMGINVGSYTDDQWADNNNGGVGGKWKALGGKKVKVGPQMQGAEVGDLIFWKDTSDPSRIASHVAFYVGNGMLFHASSPSRPIGFGEVYSNASQPRFDEVIRYPNAAKGAKIPDNVKNRNSQFALPGLNTLTASGVNVDGENLKEQAENLRKELSKLLPDDAIFISGLTMRSGEALFYDKKETEKNKTLYIEAIQKLKDKPSKNKAEQIYDTAIAWIIGEKPPAKCNITGNTDEQITVEGLSLDKTQRENIVKMLSYASSKGASKHILKTMVQAALVESRFYNYANSKIPESMNLPHDKVGSNGESVGIFQIQAKVNSYPLDRAQSIEGAVDWWLYAVEKIPNREEIDTGTLAQRVERSGNPQEYGKWGQTADSILIKLGDVKCE